MFVGKSRAYLSEALFQCTTLCKARYQPNYSLGKNYLLDHINLEGNNTFIGINCDPQKEM